MAGAEEPSQKKRKGFVFKPIPKPDRQVKVPLFHELTFGPASAPPAPDNVLKLLGQQDLFVGIDVETHQLVPRIYSKGVEGKFGHWSADLGDACVNMRVVQVGWSFGRVGLGQPTTKQHVVTPDGFRIDAQAAAKHGITNERAIASGRCLVEVLAEFIEDVTEVLRNGGRLVAHNLSFDGEVLLNELVRSGYEDKREFWTEAVKAGLCTMSPAITHWVRQTVGDLGVPYYVRMGLKEMVQLLLPTQKHMLSQHHDAGNDAELHWLVCGELCRLARVGEAVGPPS